MGRRHVVDILTRFLGIVGLGVVHMANYYTDFDVKLDKPSVKELRRERLVNAGMAASWFMLAVVWSCVVDARNLAAFLFISHCFLTSVRDAMRALSAHRQISEQIVHEVMDS